MSRIFCHILLTVLLGAFLLSTSAQAAEVKLVIKGLKGDLQRNVEAALSLPPGLEHDGKVNERWLQRLFGKAGEEAQRALEPLGYYHAVAESRLVETGGGVELRVSVKAGKPIRYGDVRVALEGAGSLRAGLQEKVEDFPLHPGEVLNHKSYEEAKLALRVAAVDRGYLRARYRTSRVSVDRDAHRADVDMVLETGPLFHFGTISIEGAENYPKFFLERYLEFEPGDIFSYRKLNLTRVNYLKSDRFDEIVLVPEIEQVEEALVPVSIRLKSGVKRRLRPGVGYATNTGVRFGLNYQELNLWSLAHRLEADLSLAQKTKSINARYTIPLGGNKENAWAFEAGLTSEDVGTYSVDIFHFEGERIFGLANDAVASLFLRQQFEDGSISSSSLRSNMLLPGTSYQQRRYDDPVNPRSGYQYRFELQGSHTSLLSDTSLVQLQGAGALMQPLGDKLTLLLRSHFGLLAHDDPLTETPVSMRFFVGGDNSVRGYSYQSRGLVDENGQVIGGDGMLTGNFELEYALSDRYGTALFYDTGSAFKAFNQVRFIHGAGVGVRIYTPVGPIKLDIAHQLNEPDPSWRIHLSVGFDL